MTDHDEVSSFSTRPLDESRRPDARRMRFRPGRGWRERLHALLRLPERFVRWVVFQKQRLGWKRFLLRCGGIAAVMVVLYGGFLWLTLPSIDEQSILAASQSTVIT